MLRACRHEDAVADGTGAKQVFCHGGRPSLSVKGRPNPMLHKIATLASGLALGACSIVGIRSGTTEPAYTVTARVGIVEIRQYGPRIAAETAVEANEDAARYTGFRRLAGYIFGGNKAKASIAMSTPVVVNQTIAMTAPVTQARDAAGRWVIRFFMPPTWTMETLPVPDDPAVRLVVVPPETIAVLGFSGDRGPDAVKAREQDLLQRLAGTQWQPVGEPVAWFYDPPWTLPWLRRNEVAVPVVTP